MRNSMVCVHYQIIKKNGEIHLENFGWWHSIESAKKDLDRYTKFGCTVKVW